MLVIVKMHKLLQECLVLQCPSFKHACICPSPAGTNDVGWLKPLLDRTNNKLDVVLIMSTKKNQNEEKSHQKITQEKVSFRNYK